MGETNNKPTSIWLLDIATTIALLAALTYVAGWTRAYHYFANFGLGLLMLEIPERYYLMYGFWVFKDWWTELVIVFAFAYVLIVILYNYYRESWISAQLPKWREKLPLLPKLVQIFVILLIFLLGWFLAVMSADQYYQGQQRKQFADYPHIWVWMKKSSPEDDTLKRVYAALPQGGYRLLLQNEDKLFIFKPPKGGKSAHIAITELAMSNVETLRVVR